MSHSVEHHLDVAPDVYDAEIRRFVPGYDAMLEEVSDAITRLRTIEAQLEILDLGAGTGALSAHLAERLPFARFTLLDVDAAMLARAKTRFSSSRDRVRFERGTFEDSLPRCDVAVASLALHHVHVPDRKREIYRNILGALTPGGFLVSADATVSHIPSLAKVTRARWAAHLVAHGDTEAQAYARFAECAKEDRYFSIEEEIEMLRGAGFRSAEVLWRSGPCSVILAI